DGSARGLADRAPRRSRLRRERERPPLRRRGGAEGGAEGRPRAPHLPRPDAHGRGREGWAVVSDLDRLLRGLVDLQRAIALDRAYQLAERTCDVCGMPATRTFTALPRPHPSGFPGQIIVGPVAHCSTCAPAEFPTDRVVVSEADLASIGELTPADSYPSVYV